MAIMIESEMIADDGGYVATVVAYGISYAAHYVNHEIRLYKISGRDLRGWQAKATPEAARKIIAERIKSLGPKFEAKHSTLYDE